MIYLEVGYPSTHHFTAALVKERLSSGAYQSEDEVLLDAMRALTLVEQRRDELRGELGERVREIEAGLVEPFDRDAFLQQMR